MKRPFLCIVALVALMFAGSFSAFADTSSSTDATSSLTCSSASPSRNAKKIFEYLEDKGYDPSYTDDFDIRFKADGKNYLIFLDSDDEEYYRVVYLFESPITFNADNLVKFIIAKEKVKKSVKVARVITVKDRGAAAVCSVFCEDADSFIPIISRCMGACRVATATFIESIEDQLKEDEEK